MWKCGIFPCLQSIHALHNSNIGSEEHPDASRKLHVGCESSRRVTSWPRRQYFLMDWVSFARKDFGKKDLFVLCSCTLFPFLIFYPQRSSPWRKPSRSAEVPAEPPLSHLWPSVVLPVLYILMISSVLVSQVIFRGTFSFLHSVPCFTFSCLELMILP